MDEKPFRLAMRTRSRSENFPDPNLLLTGGFFMSAARQSTAPAKAAGRDTRLVMIITLAMLTAMEVVLNRFLSIKTQELKIGFSFVPVVIAAMLYGPLGGGCVGALGDFIGAMLFPNGPFFPGFTLTALLTGAVFGLFLHRSQKPVRVVLSVALNQLILSLLLNSLWISVLYGSPYLPLLGTRIIQCAVLIPVQIVCILALAPAVRQIKKHSQVF